MIYTGFKQNHKLIREKDFSPKFCDGSDLSFQAQDQNLEIFDLMKHNVVQTLSRATWALSAADGIRSRHAPIYHEARATQPEVSGCVPQR